MASRAYLLLQRELYRAKRHLLPWGISANIVLDDIFRWQGTIKGPAGTPWEGGMFKVDMVFGEDFDEVPPTVHFLTVPFHPNIDMHSGRPCLDILDDPSAWFSGITIVGLMLSLQHLLSHPNLENPVNAPAAEIYFKSRRLYEQLARDCVVASRRLSAGLPPHCTDESVVENVETTEPSNHIAHTTLYTGPKPSELPKVSRLCFDDYHSFWKNVATSVPIDSDMQSKTGVIVLEGHSARSRLNEKQFREMVERQKTLWYGNFTRTQKPASRKKTGSQPRLHLWKNRTQTAEGEGTNVLNNLNRLISSSSAVDVEALDHDQASDASKEKTAADDGSGGAGSERMRDGSYSSPEISEQYDEDQEDWEKEALELEEWTSSLSFHEEVKVTSTEAVVP